MKHKFDHGIFYISSVVEGTTGGGGVHGYVFDELPGTRFPKVPCQVTLDGYKPKATGPQLKDESYNPKYKRWDLAHDLKSEKVSKEHVFNVVDGWLGFDNEGANRGELLAILLIIDSGLAESFHVFTNSKVLANGYTKHIEKWAEKDWLKPDKSPRANLDLWKRLLEYKKENPDGITISPTVNDPKDYGNVQTARNAILGIIGKSNGEEGESLLMVENTDTDYWTNEKIIPTQLRHKWCYSLTETERRTVVVDDKKLNYFMMGDHCKSNDDLELLGKKVADSGFVLTAHEWDGEIIDKVADYHTEKMWKGYDVMNRSSVMQMVGVANINKPKVTWLMKTGKTSNLRISKTGNELLTYEEELVSKAVRPPLLSFRILDEEDYMRAVLERYLFDHGHIKEKPTGLSTNVYTDVTDLFFKREVKGDGTEGACKLTDFYKLSDTSFRLMVDNPCDEDKKPVTFVRGIDTPTRNLLSSVLVDNPRLHVVTWKESKVAFRFGLILHTDVGISLYTGNYSNVRILINKDY